MSTISLDDLPDAIYRGLLFRSEQHKCSVEAEVHTILKAVVLPQPDIGAELAAIGRDLRGIGIGFECERDCSPIRAVDFG